MWDKHALRAKVLHDSPATLTPSHSHQPTYSLLPLVNGTLQNQNRSAAGIEVEVNGALQRLELLAVLEFSSDRKRMSVVVRQHERECVDGSSSSNVGAGGGGGYGNNSYSSYKNEGTSSGGSGATSRLRLICKGADNVMLERLKGESESERCWAVESERVKE